MSSQLQWGHVGRVKCKTRMSQGLRREKKERGWQVKGNNFLLLHSDIVPSFGDPSSRGTWENQSPGTGQQRGCEISILGGQ